MHSPDGDITDAFMSVAHRIRRRQVAALEPFGLSPSQGRALRVLGRAAEPVRLGYLAERLRIVPRSATDVVDSLEIAGYVVRASDPHDRRAVLLDLTESGRALMEDITRAQRTTSADTFAVLDSEDRTTLTRLLARLNDETVQ